MSKQLFIISAGASAALLQAATAIVDKATAGKLSTTMTSMAEKNAVVVGPETPVGVHTSVTAAPASPDPAYAGVKTVLVRAVLPRASPEKVQLRDALDVFFAAGINMDAEVKAATESFKKSAEVAVANAKAIGVNRVTLVLKQATKYNNVNELFRKVSTETIEAAGMTTEIQSTSVATNHLIMFPESLGVVLLNDVTSTEKIELAYAGVLGGASRTYHTVSGNKISAGHSFKSVALAVAQELRALGMGSEATKVEAAAAKNPRAVLSSL
ncbi:hypothetical protein C3747_44g141 [Trypanosoma cruzi]|uniref:Uncharacterized protein n=3 Tax=Trypanosoma cruzi TaxID=5693 RepID=Q4E0P7_TRYCC|nr:hypothetical protein, conserved [Trypanosoma cruzi]EAN98355.1 hypothetical protein, conserved [Trypanosoma cruzi]PWV13329.1 hypothetical protein C3747_44g141 [Trypanosoma cruzi]RNC47900.1 hypothetical protein TcCL_NonESM02169 [Trypanosoma cruzi]|eukprot:XP_820206.1 hypothetical protein [Trypanosoma cruzi strain CL Brener]